MPEQIKFRRDMPWLTGIPDDPIAFGALCRELYNAGMLDVANHAEGRPVAVNDLAIAIAPTSAGVFIARLTLAVTIDDR